MLKPFSCCFRFSTHGCVERVTHRVAASRHMPQPPTVVASHSSNLPSKQFNFSCLDEARFVDLANELWGILCRRP
ncbi:hypothetical protein SK128_015824 [Halocaridina rubra]|uniref:Uncharacterized protein n=1 Tax=Halocaridina rubra TaxID=373956 RepID=A0AAN8ZVX1_HALRR